MDDISRLVERARMAAQRAYAPYSGFHVGCAIESRDGSIVTGANMENASYRLGLCAEQAALAAAQHAFGLGQIARIVVAGGPAGDHTAAGKEPITPCGGCRQAIHEAAMVAGRDIEVVCAGVSGEAMIRTSIAELLPISFDLGPKG